MIRKSTAKKTLNVTVAIVLLATMIFSLLPIAPPVLHVEAAPVVSNPEIIDLPLSSTGGTTYHRIYEMYNTANGMPVYCTRKGGTLTPESTIYVLRENITQTVRIPTVGERIVAIKVIVDWYYGNEDQPADPDDDEITQAQQEETKKDFEAVKDQLEAITVTECLSEMEMMNTPL